MALTSQPCQAYASRFAPESHLQVHAAAVHRSRVSGSSGSFSGLYIIKYGYTRRLLFSETFVWEPRNWAVEGVPDFNESRGFRIHGQGVAYATLPCCFRRSQRCRFCYAAPAQLSLISYKKSEQAQVRLTAVDLSKHQLSSLVPCAPAGI